MGWFTNGASDAAAAGKADAEADVKAGGFGKAWKPGDERGEMSEKETKAYDRAYKKAAPSTWR